MQIESSSAYGKNGKGKAGALREYFQFILQHATSSIPLQMESSLANGKRAKANNGFVLQRLVTAETLLRLTHIEHGTIPAPFD